MSNTFAATRVALGIALCTALVAAAHQVWTPSFTPLAWALLGVTAGFSLSGSV
ncbi:hypothetical protein [Nonomuraea gerenzanensis]|uniref:Uncharacterized protein n=1 Tax=Nonomuraea gerenzanensis TaxID=93944 RepID=A0A1M4E5G2_9ACTN|nr:hypothetical protein [Nonomuraea gerenzanensis]UBU16253.1 hypothetical protein LCN96_14925 [Nonomuraea gerenzanensis]SBO94067.1 hypothetical protein BN4615_P3583 [Nonomuraea gerenzanensis]